MKFSIKVLLSLCVAILLEAAVFNFDVWQVRFDPNQPESAEYTAEDLTFVNWQTDGDGYVSDADPQIFVPTGSMRINSVSIEITSEPEMTECMLYFSNPDGTVSARENADIHKACTVFKLRENVGPTLRIDPGEKAGLHLSAIRVVVNPQPQLHISVSRIAAVVLIYICGSLLFRIQRMPDYTRYIQKKKEEE